MRRLVIFVGVGLLIFGCDKREVKYSYFENGVMRTRYELLNEKLHGKITLFYPSGQIKEIQSWSHGLRDGVFESYSNDGKIEKRKLYNHDKIIEAEIYWEKSNQVKERQYFNVMGKIIDALFYKSNGERDSIPYPILFLDKGDTVSYKSKNILTGRVVNLVDTSYQASHLIITSRFDTLSNDILRPVDTLAIVENSLQGYKYEFSANHRGDNVIYGVFVFKREDAESIYVESLTVDYPYFVR